jgi:ATP-dependent DNA helicase RecG
MGTIAVERALSAPPEEVGSALLALAEGQWFERKSNRIAARDLADALIGFANADGGFLVVGLHDGKVEGASLGPGKLNEQMQANIDCCQPPVRARHREVECIDSEGRTNDLLVFEVESSREVHANRRDEVFLRVGDENRRLGFVQRQELLFDKGQASYESRVVDRADFGLLDDDVLREYAAAIRAPDEVRLLRARGLAEGDRLTIAGTLLFAEAPQAFFPEAYVRILRYHGHERGSGARQQLVDDVRIEGPIPKQLIEARGQIAALQPARRALLDSGRFGDVPLVPEDAWLEGLVNAVVHRSYSMAGDHIRVEIFDDRIEISSPGRFPGLVDLEEPLKTHRFARNPRIARVCSDLNFGQELGEGIRRIFEEMRQAGLIDPVYRQTAGSVELSLLAEPVDRALADGLPANAKKITGALMSAGRLSTGEVAELLGLSRPVVQRELATLREAGIIEWVGKSPKDPRAYWKLATK